ncbi:hypothetical protein [Halococcus hamelinensis]|uniref:hypothetical protein n=1 Tax=Halococcus hamelinensis TaxID=332168 RepID=UPI000B253219|nr:hypothetical protein [Halococcus hamelinensis]
MYSEPIFPIHLLRRRTIAGVDALSFMVGIGLLGGTTYLPVFLQTVPASRRPTPGCSSCRSSAASWSRRRRPASS